MEYHASPYVKLYTKFQFYLQMRNQRISENEAKNQKKAKTKHATAAANNTNTNHKIAEHQTCGFEKIKTNVVNALVAIQTNVAYECATLKFKVNIVHNFKTVRFHHFFFFSNSFLINGKYFPTNTIFALFYIALIH